MTDRESLGAGLPDYLIFQTAEHPILPALVRIGTKEQVAHVRSLVMF